MGCQVPGGGVWFVGGCLGAILVSLEEAGLEREMDPQPIDDVIETLKQDYARFPQAQTYALYADDVYFKDPLNQFRGVRRYQEMIGSLQQWLPGMKLDLHEIRPQSATSLLSQWTLSWTVPLPWHPRPRIDGWTVMELNEQGLIGSHVDGWKCTRWDVVKQVFWG